jgi:hypothetical protein
MCLRRSIPCPFINSNSAGYADAPLSWTRRFLNSGSSSGSGNEAATAIKKAPHSSSESSKMTVSISRREHLRRYLVDPEYRVSVSQRWLMKSAVLRRFCYNRFTNPSLAACAGRELAALDAGAKLLDQVLHVKRQTNVAASATASSPLVSVSAAVNPPGLRSLALRLAQLAYLVPHDGDATQLKATFVERLAAHDYFREALDGLELVDVSSEFLVMYDRSARTVFAAVRGTDLNQSSWYSDLLHGVVTGCDSRVERLEGSIDAFKLRLRGGGTGAERVRRVVVVGHSLGGAVVLRYCQKHPAAYGVAINPGESAMILSAGLELPASAAGRVAILRMVGDVITHFVRPKHVTLLEEDDPAVVDKHALRSFTPTLEHSMDELANHHLRALQHFEVLLAFTMTVAVVLLLRF